MEAGREEELLPRVRVVLLPKQKNEGGGSNYQPLVSRKFLCEHRRVLFVPPSYASNVNFQTLLTMP